MALDAPTLWTGPVRRATRGGCGQPALWPSRQLQPSPAAGPEPGGRSLPTSFGFLSSYPPTQCGLATFTAALRSELVAAGERTGVVRVLPRSEPSLDPAVIAQMVHGEPGAVIRAAAALGAFDVAVVQHEFGIYGGPDGDSVVGVLALLDVPSIVVAHTVLADPTPHQRAVLERVADHASILVTMSETARRRLVECYDVDASRVVVIPHGAPAPTALVPTVLAPPVERAASPRLLTWGLLGPGKGIERVVDVLPSLRDLAPRPHYLVLGETHPRVLESEGERYRDALRERAERLGVADMMTLRAGYLDVASLRRVVATADVVVLPYDSHEQVTSGVLIEAVAARKPVVATAFAHACELLGSGAGLVVDHDDPGAMASALRRVLCEPGLAGAMASRAGDLASELLWPAVAARYHALGARLARDRSVAVA